MVAFKAAVLTATVASAPSPVPPVIAASANAPRILIAESFQDAMNKMNKITNSYKKIERAEQIIHQIDDILKKMASKTNPENIKRTIPEENEPSK